MKRVLFELFCFCTLVFFLGGCCLGDVVYEYTYEIENNSSSDITVRVYTINAKDTFDIQSGETQLVAINDFIRSACNRHRYTSDQIEGFLDSLIVSNDNSVPSNKDYLDKNSWSFDEGDYFTFVTDEEFE